MDDLGPTGTIFKSMAVFLNLSVIMEPDRYPAYRGTPNDVAADRVLTGVLGYMLGNGEIYRDQCLK